MLYLSEVYRFSVYRYENLNFRKLKFIRQFECYLTSSIWLRTDIHFVCSFKAFLTKELQKYYTRLLRKFLHFTNTSIPLKAAAFSIYSSDFYPFFHFSCICCVRPSLYGAEADNLICIWV